MLFFYSELSGTGSVPPSVVSVEINGKYMEVGPEQDL